MSSNYEKLSINNDRYVTLSKSDKSYVVYPNLENYKIIPNTISPNVVTIQLNNISQPMDEIIGPNVQNIILQRNINKTTYDHINARNLNINIFVHYENINKIITHHKNIYIYYSEKDVSYFYQEQKINKSNTKISCARKEGDTPSVKYLQGPVEAKGFVKVMSFYKSGRELALCSSLTNAMIAMIGIAI